MATEDNFIVAIELGSSKVTGLVAQATRRRHSDFSQHTRAFGQLYSQRTHQQSK